MPRAKLTPADRNQIAQRFRETPATATSLAAEHAVSISTIIRILKEELTAAGYDALVPQKRAGRWQEQPTVATTPAPPSASQIRSYRPVTDSPAPPLVPAESSTLPEPAPVVTPAAPKPAPIGNAQVVQPQEPEASPALEETEPAGLPEWEGDVQDDWDDDENDEEESPGASFEPAPISQQILPLAASALPHTCYLVVDRFAELVARPLTEFSHWGELPVTSDTARTLPVFDNHRVAKRFSGRGHRILKVPDANLIYKTSGYLHDKGITHLLINGQVYTVGQMAPDA
ncbi:hypothetical protein GlitD10_2954 [Gloeomargarita lithophora Alchichica-D10]|uniref:Transposase n=1 Tax=Gloeomargarita lithophora Alchichica-D10 TaxID=1188229 RepID=A0A1J0AHC5_9CYAN|nr:hypothetical protein [Gloeomargarita lithophora]APB35299.1 hypothetical protein GlitD10_2954 [Gloeomargarita lithophora Alchichica-D10]